MRTHAHTRRRAHCGNRVLWMIGTLGRYGIGGALTSRHPYDSGMAGQPKARAAKRAEAEASAPLRLHATAESALAVMERMREGISISKACEACGVVLGSFYRSVEGDGPLAAEFMRAREAMVHAMAVGIIDIADDETVNPNVTRNRLDARKWVASRLLPLIYGDRLNLDHSGSIQIQPVITRWSGPAPAGGEVIDAASAPSLPTPDASDGDGDATGST